MERQQPVENESFGPHWTEPYVGLTYTPAHDCAWLVAKVLRERFGAHVDLPSDREWREQSQQRIASIARRFADPVVVPHEGDVVLMRVLGRRRTLGSHVGVHVSVGGRAHVLHALERVGSVLQREASLWPHLEVTGYYRIRR